MHKPANSGVDVGNVARRCSHSLCFLTFTTREYLFHSIALIQNGALGQIISFQGEFSEDFMADPISPWPWRCDADYAGGALADLGSHLLAMARYLMGNIQAVCADTQTVHAQRPVTLGGQERREVAVDDQVNALLRFANDARGTFSSSWLKHGYKNHLSFEISGTRGMGDSPGDHGVALGRNRRSLNRPYPPVAQGPLAEHRNAITSQPCQAY